MEGEGELIHRESVGTFDVEVPGITMTDLPKIVFISNEKSRACLRVKKRQGASGSQLWVSPNTLKRIPDQSSVTWSPAKSRQFYFHMLFHGPGHRFVLAGLVMAIIGLGLRGSIDIGKEQVLINVSSGTVAVLLIVSYLMQISGLVVIFVDKFLRQKL